MSLQSWWCDWDSRTSLARTVSMTPWTAYAWFEPMCQHTHHRQLNHKDVGQAFAKQTEENHTNRKSSPLSFPLLLFLLPPCLSLPIKPLPHEKKRIDVFLIITPNIISDSRCDSQLFSWNYIPGRSNDKNLPNHFWEWNSIFKYSISLQVFIFGIHGRENRRLSHVKFPLRGPYIECKHSHFTSRVL